MRKHNAHFDSWQRRLGPKRKPIRPQWRYSLSFSTCPDTHAYTHIWSEPLSLAKLLPGLGITTPLDKMKATLAATPLKEGETPVCLVSITHKKYLNQWTAVMHDNHVTQSSLSCGCPLRSISGTSTLPTGCTLTCSKSRAGTSERKPISWPWEGSTALHTTRWVRGRWLCASARIHAPEWWCA